MRQAGWRVAAAAWAVTLAAVGVGIARYGHQGDGTHYDFCRHGTAIPASRSAVTLTSQDAALVLHVEVGQSFTARIDGGASPVVEPRVIRRGVVCQATRSAPAKQLAVTYIATRVGTTTLLSTHQENGAPAGINVAVFQATIIVAP
jgi:hypothetical protein